MSDLFVTLYYIILQNTILKNKAPVGAHRKNHITLGPKVGGKFVELMAAKFCDDYLIRQSFMVGLLSKTHLLLHDSYVNVKDEFMLTSFANYYDNEETSLGKVIRFTRDLHHIDQEQINKLKSKDEININKDEIYKLVDRALIWTEIVCRALQI